MSAVVKHPAAGGPAASPTREVLALAIPALASGFVQMAYHWVNQAWVGRLPDATTATAALSVAVFLMWALMALSSLFATGASAIVGRYVGAGRESAARYVALHALRWALVAGVVVGAVGFALAPAVYRQANVSAAAAVDGAAYTRIAWVGAFAMLGQAACDAAWRGHGNTRVPLLTSAIGLGLNAALDPLFLFGWGPVPAMGLPGAAVATVIASGIAFAISARLLVRRGRLSSERPPDAVLRLDPTTRVSTGRVRALDVAVAARLVRVGLPVTANGIFFVVVYVFLSRVVTDVGGDAAQAGLGVGLRGEGVAFLIGAGFSVAAASLTARRMGAGRADDAARLAWRATALASAGCLVWTGVTFFVPDLLADLFLADGPDTAAAREHAIAYWRLVAFCLVPQCWEVVLEGAFAGAGMTLPPMIVTMLLSAARVPLAWWAAVDLGHGVPGIWTVIAATAALRGVLIAVWFSRGTWKKRTV